MAAHDPDDLRERELEAHLEQASIDVARAIWNVVLLSRDEGKSRGLLGKASRKTLVEKIKALAQLLRMKR